ncbi:MAG TPA: 4-hydroxythreonine-4-phosphate dehydrogenase PdxA [Dehalococcoidia bacterium]|nr:4-hydroxythreonine-4-phosphate dehydrogenase PdxA [Dehalococcoidia bacterium]
MGSSRPLIAITLGDPAGIGAEVVVKALAIPAVRAACRPLLVGDAATLCRALELCGFDWPLDIIEAAALDADPSPGRIALLDVPIRSGEPPPFGVLSAEAGDVAVRAVETACDLALAGRVAGIVTAPLNKEAMRLAGYAYDGHTELLAVRTGAGGVCMLLAGERLRVSHVTGHRALREAALPPSAERLRQVFTLTAAALRRLGFPKPRIAVAGLNPHAGEGGLFGSEEIEVLAPAIAAAQAATADCAISGPYPADTIFRRAAAGEFDGVVAMYHDQGHIPVKMIEFDSAVNVTLGLPIIRTSPDHGTAFDIAGKGVANPANMIAAIRLAARMASHADAEG